ncbi:MAG: hypothetical protein JSW28_10055, partial [Thermoplasmata archaeon]
MRDNRGKERASWAGRWASILVVWLLVMGGFLVMFPFNQPGAKGEKFHESGSATFEDGNFGGFDYNGGDVGDKKITWFAADSPHIVNNTFIVEDGYILEIEAGCEVRLNDSIVLQIGQTTRAAFYCNGSLGVDTTFKQKVAGSPWQGIYLVEGGYGNIEHTNVSGGGLFYILNSSLDMSYCNVFNMDAWGIYAPGSTVSVTHCAINNTASPAIRAIGSDLTVADSQFRDISS